MLHVKSLVSSISLVISTPSYDSLLSSSSTTEFSNSSGRNSRYLLKLYSLSTILLSSSIKSAKSSKSSSPNSPISLMYVSNLFNASISS